MMFVRLSYHSLKYDDHFILSDAGVIDLNTKCKVSLSEIEDIDNFGWLELTADNLENICEYCSNLGIEFNGLKGQLSIRINDDQSYWSSNDRSYRLDLKSDSGEDFGLVNKIFEIELGLWKSKLSMEVKNLKRIANSLNH